MLFYIKSLDLSNVIDPILQSLKNIISKSEKSATDSCTNLDLHIFSSKPLTNHPGVRTFMNWIIEVYRHYQLQKNEQETILSPNNQAVIIQIIMHQLHLELNTLEIIRDLQLQIIKRKLEEIKTSDNDTYQINSKKCFAKSQNFNTDNSEEIFLAYKTFLNNSNMVDWVDVMKRLIEESQHNIEIRNNLCKTHRHIVLLGNMDDVVEQEFFDFLKFGEDKIYDVSISMSLDASFNKELTPENLTIETTEITYDELVENLFETSKITESQSKSPGQFTSEISSSRTYVVQVILSYLELLVNSRNELSLATAINVPNRNIEHKSFTQIKHEAMKKKLSMYQTILSFITRIRLGGKGYAPPSDCPLSNHVKGLSEFTDELNKLHAILEIDLDVKLSAISRILNSIKNCLSKPSMSFSNKLLIKKSVLDKSVQHISRAVDIELKKFSIGNAKSEGTSINGIHTLRLIRNTLDYFSSLHFHESGFFSSENTLTQTAKTPVRLSTLASKFRTPDEVEHVQKKRKLVDRTNQINEMGHKKDSKLIPHLDKNVSSNKILEKIPQKKDLTDETRQNMKENEHETFSGNPAKKLKSDETIKKKGENKKDKRKHGAAIKQIQGQAKLSSFFR